MDQDNKQKVFQDELEHVRNSVLRKIREDNFPNAITLPILRDAVLLYPQRSGKLMRPALLMWVNRMLGGREECALATASAVELFHLWSLIHDDIIDQDDARRGGPTVHHMVMQHFRREGLNPKKASHNGMALGILAGDLVLNWSTLMICADENITCDTKQKILLRITQWLHPALVTGEALDVVFEHRSFAELSIAELYHMLELKTGALLRFCAEAGAMLALEPETPWDDPRVLAIGRFARDLGIAFQLRDDILGII
ncbi:MAG: hypothetical protein D6820_18100, partial [Lentisphaerae bacterium]